MQRVDKLEDLRSYKRPVGGAGFAFHRIGAAERSQAPAPLFVLGPQTRVVHEELFGQFDTPEIGCYRLEGGGVAGSGIAVQGDTAFTAPSLLHPRHVIITIVGKLAERPLPRRHVSGALAVIYGPAYQTYGHWLADFLPRLWVLAASGHDIDDIAYAVPHDLGPVAREMLLRIGISPARLIDHDPFTELLTADVLLVPTGLRLGNRIGPQFGEATRFWIGRVQARSRLPPSPAGARVFLSRGRVSGQRVMLNRAAVEAIAAERGFLTVCPEASPFIEQVALFAGASMIAGEYGSALHGSVFAPPGAVTLGLRGNSRHPSFIQSGVAAAMGQTVGYLLGDTQGQDVEQRFTVDTADVERALDIVEAQAGLAPALAA